MKSWTPRQLRDPLSPGLGRRAFLVSGAAALAAASTAHGGDDPARTAGAAKAAGEFDVCVVGGSCTGVFAAVRAAAAGMRVALVERNYFFGGTATAGFVPVWHSLFSLDGSRRIVGGYTQQVVERLAAKGLATLHDAKDGRSESAYCFFNTAALQGELDRMVKEGGVRTFFGASFVAAEVDRPGHVARAVIEDKSGRRDGVDHKLRLRLQPRRRQCQRRQHKRPRPLRPDAQALRDRRHALRLERLQPRQQPAWIHWRPRLGQGRRHLRERRAAHHAGLRIAREPQPDPRQHGRHRPPRKRLLPERLHELPFHWQREHLRRSRERLC